MPLPSIDVLAQRQQRASAAFHAITRTVEPEATRASLYLLAAHALDLRPDATHLLLEASDQGDYMIATGCSLSVPGQPPSAAYDDWYQRAEDHELDSVASYLSWGDPHWKQYADPSHEFHRPNGGYYALDLARIVADYTEPATTTDLAAALDDIAALVGNDRLDATGTVGAINAVLARVGREVV